MKISLPGNLFSDVAEIGEKRQVMFIKVFANKIKPWKRYSQIRVPGIKKNS